MENQINVVQMVQDKLKLQQPSPRSVLQVPDPFETEVDRLSKSLKQPVAAQKQEQAPATTTSINTGNPLLLKLNEIEGNNVYVLAEKVEILHQHSTEMNEGLSPAEIVSIVTNVTTLITALVELLAALVSYKEAQKSKSKKNSELFSEESDEPPLVQININNQSISIVNFEVPTELASSIFRQAGIKPRKGNDAIINGPKGVTVMLEPEIAAAFSTPAAINEALRMVKDLAQLVNSKQEDLKNSAIFQAGKDETTNGFKPTLWEEWLANYPSSP